METSTLSPPGEFLDLEPELLIRLHGLMVRGRVLEERLIAMNKTGQGYFWIGGPGEEAFKVALGLQIKKGQGPMYDYLHLNYRSSALLLALGAKPIDTIRQMRTAATDPFSKGRQFVNHPAIFEWNVAPVSPTIQTQYATSIGTAIAQARAGGNGVTVAIGGDGGTSQGDFHSCLVWSNRPVLPLPMLIVVMNNGYAISTPFCTQHGENRCSDWGHVFDMPHETCNGNDPAASYRALETALDYCRHRRRPYLLEAKVSRLHGHSSSSGANRVNEPDCIAIFEEKLVRTGLRNRDNIDEAWRTEREAIEEACRTANDEPLPDPESIWEDVFDKGIPPSYPMKGGS